MLLGDSVDKRNEYKVDSSTWELYDLIVCDGSPLTFLLEYNHPEFFLVIEPGKAK